jgi:hypothetical protein
MIQNSRDKKSRRKEAKISRSGVKKMIVFSDLFGVFQFMDGCYFIMPQIGWCMVKFP